eukprot:m.1171508 g.1171508  ORF g.1171508 m.1171508 type:complete len:319 (-) comp24514_c0_seq13:3634-4590(-)
MASSCGVHDVAVQGYNDTKAADLYAAARPGYSEEAVTRVLRETNTLHRDGWGLRTNTTVLDLGAGTGKMTLSLVGRALFQKDEYGDIVLRKETPSGIQIIAVEPVEGMRKKCKEQLLTCGHGVTVKEEYQRDCDHEANGLQPVFNLNGSGSQIPLPTASVDLVVIAQAFHWFASRESMEEIARVLKRGTGQLALIWNTRDKSVEWVNQLEEDVVDPLYPVDVPRQQTGRWKYVFEDTPTLFDELQGVDLRIFRQRGGLQMIIDRVLSLSVVTSRSQRERDDVQRRVTELMQTHPDTQGIQPEDLELPYVTEIYWCRRR